MRKKRPQEIIESVTDLESADSGHQCDTEVSNKEDKEETEIETRFGIKCKLGQEALRDIIEPSSPVKMTKIMIQ